MKNFKQNKGITLIALIVTIITLIVIAGVSMAALTGENGVIQSTNDAKVTSIAATAREQVELACSALKIAIAEASSLDNSYSAIANSNLIQKKLLEVLNADLSGLNGSFTNGGAEAGNNQDSFTIVYTGDDYSNASNDDASKIKYTISLSQKGIELTGEKAGNEFTVTLSSNNESAGTVSFTGEHSGTSLTLKGEQSITFLATVNAGNTFTGWYEGNTLLSEDLECTLTVSGDKNITARFETAFGLYKTGTNYTELLYTWDELISDGYITVTDGVLSSKYGFATRMTGDLLISNDITALGKMCASITGVRIPNSVTTIGDKAFSGCTNLKEIEIPDSVTSIGESIFYNCTGLHSANVPYGISTIPYYAFYGCTSLTNIEIPNTVTSIASSAFYGSGLTSIEVPDSVLSIGNYAFSGCKSLENATIGNSITLLSHDMHIFDNCTNLKSVKIGSGVTNIQTGNWDKGSYLFTGCINLENIVVDVNNTSYHSNGNCIVETASKTLVAGCKNSIIPTDGSVTSIGKSAFANCTNLTNIYIPSNVKSINTYAFYNCTSMTGTLVISSGITSIGNSAFRNCTGLTSVEIPANVSSFGSNVFTGCTSLTNLTVDANNTTYHSDGNCIIKTSSKELIFGCNSSVIPADGSVTSIADAAFRECTTLTNIAIPACVTSLGSQVFYKCTNLQDIMFIGDSQLRSIGFNTFNNCTSLTNIDIPASVTSINKGAFSYCPSLTNLTVDANNTTYHSNGNCIIKTSTKQLIVGCKNSIIPADGSVTSIGYSAFQGCIGLTKVEIPASITSIDQYAFFDCSGLISMTVLIETPPTFGSSMLANCSSLTTIKVPSTSIDAYKAASGWSSYANKIVAID